MFCSHCGNEVPEKAEFCPKCGRPLVKVTTDNDVNNKVEKDIEESTIPSKKRIGLIIGLAIICVIVIVGACVFIMNNLGKRENGVSTQSESSSHEESKAVQDDKIVQAYYDLAQDFSRSGIVTIADINNDGIVDMLYRTVTNKAGEEVEDALKYLENGIKTYNDMTFDGTMGQTGIYTYNTAEDKVKFAAAYKHSSNYYKCVLVNNDTLWESFGLYDDGGEKFVSYDKDFKVKSVLSLHHARNTNASGFESIYYIDNQAVSVEKYSNYSIDAAIEKVISEGKEYTPSSKEHFAQSVKCLDCFSNTPEGWKEHFSGLKDNGSTQTESLGVFYDKELCELASNYYYAKTGERCSDVAIDHRDGNIVAIQLFDDMGDHTATHDWYFVDITTGKTTNMSDEVFNLFDTSVNTNAPKVDEEIKEADSVSEDILKTIYGKWDRRYVVLCGIYGKELYFMPKNLESSFWKINLETKEMKQLNIGQTVTVCKHFGYYFLMHDGSGAGISYLGVWNAKDGTFKKIAQRPSGVYAGYKDSVYCVETNRGDMLAGEPINVTVKKYDVKTGEITTLVSSLDCKNVKSISSECIEYTDLGGNVKRIDF